MILKKSHSLSLRVRPDDDPGRVEENERKNREQPEMARPPYTSG
jgi:hypothetical protein